MLISASLELAKKYNFLLLEDDAYAFLYYGPEGRQARSYFALEPEVNSETGRVIRRVQRKAQPPHGANGMTLRFDSFSKVLSSGMRLGYMTASPRICTAVNLITSNTLLVALCTYHSMPHVCDSSTLR